MTTTAPKLITKDNGYFEVWSRPCGHSVRVTTEFNQWGINRPGRRAALHAATRERLAAATCPRCANDAAALERSADAAD